MRWNALECTGVCRDVVNFRYQLPEVDRSLIYKCKQPLQQPITVDESYLPLSKLLTVAADDEGGGDSGSYNGGSVSRSGSGSAAGGLAFTTQEEHARAPTTGSGVPGTPVGESRPHSPLATFHRRSVVAKVQSAHQLSPSSFCLSVASVTAELGCLTTS
jgi:hypothetical protein